MSFGFWDLRTVSSANFPMKVNGTTALTLNNDGSATTAGALGVTGLLTAAAGLAVTGAASATGNITAPNLSRIIASSGTAASVTGTASETQLASITIPANTLGANGTLRITTTWFSTNSANNKQYRVRYSGSGGGAFLSFTSTTTGAVSFVTMIFNKNATNSQGGGSVGAGASSTLTTSADTTGSTSVYISGALSNTGETITLLGYTVEFIPGV